MSTSRSRTDERVAMSSPPDAGERRPAPIGEDARERLLAAMPVAERRMRLAGVSTAVLEGGDGPPVVLLHGAGEFAATRLRIIPKLATTHRVVAPDLPGHGASEVSESSLDADRVLAWLGELIEATCASAAGAGRAPARRRDRRPLRQHSPRRAQPSCARRFAGS